MQAAGGLGAALPSRTEPHRGPTPPRSPPSRFPSLRDRSHRHTNPLRSPNEKTLQQSLAPHDRPQASPDSPCVCVTSQKVCSEDCLCSPLTPAHLLPFPLNPTGSAACQVRPHPGGLPAAVPSASETRPAHPPLALSHCSGPRAGNPPKTKPPQAQPRGPQTILQAGQGMLGRGQ